MGSERLDDPDILDEREDGIGNRVEVRRRGPKKAGLLVVIGYDRAGNARLSIIVAKADYTESIADWVLGFVASAQPPRGGLTIVQ